MDEMVGLPTGERAKVIGGVKGKEMAWRGNCGILTLVGSVSGPLGNRVGVCVMLKGI